MIDLVPAQNITVTCQMCKSDTITIKKILFHGVHTLVDCLCQNCGFDFYQTLPIGHDLTFPIQFSPDGKKSFYHPKAKAWLAQPLITSVAKELGVKAEISLHVNKTTSDVIVVNILDNCFGHVFTKVWNAYTLIKSHPNWGIVVICPAQCAWMLPVDIAESWIVHLPLNKLNQKIEGLDEFVKLQFKRFNKITLSHTYTHLDHHRYINLEEVLKTPRFDLTKFSESDPHITFIWREDRFWHNSHLMDLLFMGSVKFKIQSVFKPIFVYRQLYLITKSARIIAKQFPKAIISIAGLGKTGTFNQQIFDCRVKEITPEIEIQWNMLFSKSHLVIGVHGSNMLIPSGLSAGFINLVPRYKIDHVTEDTILPYSNRILQFLGRHLDEYSTPLLVALHASSILKQFPYIFNNTNQEPE